MILAYGFASFALLATTFAVASKPVLPDEYSLTAVLRMPYVGLHVPIDVYTSSTCQKISYYDGLEVDWRRLDGTYKYVYNGSTLNKAPWRECLYAGGSGSGPTAAGLTAAAPSNISGLQHFLPDLDDYTYTGEENINGLLCQRFAKSHARGTTGVMSDDINFYWDAVDQRPVRWHMFSRYKVDSSHTDIYIIDYIHFESGPPRPSDLALVHECDHPVTAVISVTADGFLTPSLSSTNAVDLHFTSFAHKYNKAYQTEEEKGRRRDIFTANLAVISKANQAHEFKTSFRVNQFADLTHVEFMRLRGGYRPSKRTPEQAKYVQKYTSTSLVEEGLPRDLDWRLKMPKAIPPVKDQEFCGSCWAFSMIGTVEAMVAIKNQRQAVLLPEQFLVDCTWSLQGDDGNFGCDGGESSMSALEVVTQFGGRIPTAMAYGQTLGVDGYCKNISSMPLGALILGWATVPAGSDATLMAVLAMEGPLSLGIMVPGEMTYYDSGVIDAKDGACNLELIDHLVVGIGYGFDSKVGKPYWLIRNSWSTYWGERGYFRVARGARDFCINQQAGFPLVAIDDGSKSRADSEMFVLFV